MPVGLNSIGRPAEPIGAACTAGGGPGAQRMLGGGDCGDIGWLSTRPTGAGGAYRGSFTGQFGICEAFGMDPGGRRSSP